MAIGTTHRIGDYLEPAVIHICPADGLRLDAFLATMFPEIERIAAGKWIRDGLVSVSPSGSFADCRPIRPAIHLQRGEHVKIQRPAARAAEARPEAIALPILYRDADLVVVNKPAGMATHPGPGWWSGSAVNALLHHVSHWRPIGEVATPGIVHRLDRDTGGLLAFANGQTSLEVLLSAMRAREIERNYLAVVSGTMYGTGTIDRPLGRDPMQPERVIVTPGGRDAITHWQVVATVQGRSLLALQLATGRTHQVRVHLAHHGHPVVGDPWYGAGNSPCSESNGVMHLFAYRLALAHPRTGQPLAFVSTPPWLSSFLNLD